MLEPWKYGLPFGGLLYLLLSLQLFIEWSDLTIFRWIIGEAAVVVMSTLLYRAKSPVFGFREAWFSSFSVCVAAHVTFAMLIWILNGLWSQAELMTDHDLFGMMIMEFISGMFFALVFNTIAAYFLKRPNKQ